MAFYSMHAYDADVWIPSFIGLNESDDNLNGDLRLASELQNVETPNGVLQPAAGGTYIGGTFDGHIGTLAVFYRRWYTGDGNKTWLVVASGGHLYARQNEGSIDWVQLPLPEGVTVFANDVWSYVTSEDNTGDGTVDVLLMSNADDGMIMVTPPDRNSVWDDHRVSTWTSLNGGNWTDAYSPVWHVEAVSTRGYKFGVIERYAERIWGGNVADEPDLLVYSAPFDPTDWTRNVDSPEDGGGEIRQPSWDGDRFTALKSFGSQLLAFKEHRIWRIMGTNPGEYVFIEQFGGGSPYHATVEVDRERVLMASVDGMSVYDGAVVSPFMRGYTEDLWRSINHDRSEYMSAAIWQNRYYLSFSTGESQYNNCTLIYDLVQGGMTKLTYGYSNFSPFGDTLYATLGTATNDRVFAMKYDSWEQGINPGDNVKWVSPWIDFGRKNIQKGGFDLYFSPELKRVEGVDSNRVTFIFRIQTEKKVKEKQYTYTLLNPYQEASGKGYKVKRLHFSGMGRRFRITVEVASGCYIPWRLVGGLHVVAEIDTD